MSARFWRVFKSRLVNVITHGHVIWHVKCWPKLLLEPGDATKDRHGNGPDATLFRQRSVMSWSRSRIVLRLPTDLQVSIDHSQWLIGQLDNYKCPGRTCVKSMHGICPPLLLWSGGKNNQVWSSGAVELWASSLVLAASRNSLDLASLMLPTRKCQSMRNTCVVRR